MSCSELDTFPLCSIKASQIECSDIVLPNDAIIVDAFFSQKCPCCSVSSTPKISTLNFLSCSIGGGGGGGGGGDRPVLVPTVSNDPLSEPCGLTFEA